MQKTEDMTEMQIADAAYYKVTSAIHKMMGGGNKPAALIELIKDYGEIMYIYGQGQPDVELPEDKPQFSMFELMAECTKPVDMSKFFGNDTELNSKNQ